jgi:hypothetical protein
VALKQRAYSQEATIRPNDWSLSHTLFRPRVQGSAGFLFGESMFTTDTSVLRGGGEGNLQIMSLATVPFNIEADG